MAEFIVVVVIFVGVFFSTVGGLNALPKFSSSQKPSSSASQDVSQIPQDPNTPQYLPVPVYGGSKLDTSYLHGSTQGPSDNTLPSLAGEDRSYLSHSPLPSASAAPFPFTYDFSSPAPSYIPTLPDKYRDPRTNILISYVPDPGMFPDDWLKGPTSASFSPIDTIERNRAQRIILTALAKYPTSMIVNHLYKVYVLKSMNFFGVGYGGTSTLLPTKTIFLADAPATERWLEELFHHEFSALLQAQHPNLVSSASWNSINDPKFKYGSGGAAAIIAGQASLNLDPNLAATGFINQYSMSAQLQDRNEIAENLMINNPTLWSFASKYPKISAKIDQVIGFYHQIDSTFSKFYFKSLDTPPGF